MIITKMALPRRTFLRGMGATLALPMLDAMVPALAAQAATAESRCPGSGFFYAPNGTYLPNFHPAGVGTNFELTPVLKPLESLRERHRRRQRPREQGRREPERGRRRAHARAARRG